MTMSRNLKWVLGGFCALFAGMAAYIAWLALTAGGMSFLGALVSGVSVMMFFMPMYLVLGIPVFVVVIIGWKFSGRIQRPWRKRCVRTGLVALMLTPADAGHLGVTPAILMIVADPLSVLMNLLVVWGVLMTGVAGYHWLQSRRRWA